MAGLRPALSGLTTRGRSFLAAGLAAAICALLLGQRDLLRVALLLIALPLGCALVLGRARYRLALTRTVTPLRVVSGSSARVRLDLQNLTQVPSRVLLAEDEVPYALGDSPRFVLARLPAGQQASVSYSVRSQLRGRYPIGPLRLRLADPFGMCEVSRAFTATDPLIVVPRTWPLTPVPAGGQWAGAGESSARSASASGEDDLTVREYRDGDDLRRVHWRSTARRGELMVRRDEQPRQMRATVLLDTRIDGHRGEGAAGSFEWAVSAAASAAVWLAGQQYGVRVLVDSHAPGWLGPHGDAAGQLLDHLAIVEQSGPQTLPAAVSTLVRGQGDGVVVAVLGEVDEQVATALARLGRQGVRGIALLVCTTQWAALPAHRAAELDGERAKVAAVLSSGGWSVGLASANDTVATVWARTTRTQVAARHQVARLVEPGTR